MTNVQEAAARLRQLAALEPKHPVLVCDGCGKCWPDDDASDSESCDCGRFKQRMEWADAVDVAKDAVKALELVPADDAEPITPEWLESLGWQHEGSCWCPSMTGPSNFYVAFDEGGQCDLGIVGSRLKIRHATRGDFRRLLSLLPLSESPARQEPTANDG